MPAEKLCAWRKPRPGAWSIRRILYQLTVEVLIGEIFYSLKEEQIVIEQGVSTINTVRPHSSLGYSPPTLKPLYANLRFRRGAYKSDLDQPINS